MTPFYVQEVFAKLVEQAHRKVGFDVYFDYGHVTEIIKKLKEKEESISCKEKFPLVWLVMDFPEETGQPGVYAKVSLDVIITTGTSAEATMDERKQTTFRKVLYPIYEALLQAIEQSPLVSKSYNVPHTRIVRPHWSGEKGDSLTNVFLEPIDAIQIKGLKLSINNPC